MDMMKTAPRPSTRLSKGNVLLANAQVVNTKPVKTRFDAFVDIHRNYLEAQTKVEQAETLERGELQRIEQLDGVHDKAIAALSAALLLDGEPMRNTFGRFADFGPGQLSALPFAEQVKATRNLVATLRRSMGLSEATLSAADQAEQAALKVEEALPGWELRRSYLAMARQTRDSLGAKWDTAYGALRHLTLSMVEAPDLYATLFAGLRRNGKKPKAATAVTPPAAEPTVDTNASPADVTPPPAAIAVTPPPSPQAV